MLGEPHAFMKCLNQTPPEPWVKSATASGPCRFDPPRACGRSRSAPRPRRPPRRRPRRASPGGRAASSAGPDRRAGRSRRRRAGRACPRESGWSGFPVIFVTRPSFTCARTPQPQKQSSQYVATTRSPSVRGSGTGSRSSPHHRVARPDAAATPPAAAPIWMNLRRVIAMCSLLRRGQPRSHFSMQPTSVPQGRLREPVVREAVLPRRARRARAPAGCGAAARRWAGAPRARRRARSRADRPGRGARRCAAAAGAPPPSAPPPRALPGPGRR